MKKTVLKALIRKITPHKLRFLIRIIRKGLFGKHIAEIKQFKNDRKYAASDFPLYLSFVAIAKNETPYIAEWIEYHLLVGVQKFFIYDNESADNLREYLESYIKDGIVEYNYFPGNRQQIAAYNDAINRYKYSSFWLAFIDIDEFLVPVNNRSIPDFLRNFEDVPGIEVDQVKYGSSGHEKKTNALVIERFKNHSSLNIFPRLEEKSIVNPRYVLYMTVHIAEYFNGEYSVDTHKHKKTEKYVNRPALYDKLRYNHYACKSLEEFVSRTDRGRAASPGKLSIDDFYERDYNEEKNDTIMDKYIQKIKEKLKLRFGSNI